MFGRQNKTAKHRSHYDVPTKVNAEEQTHTHFKREGSHTDVTVSGNCMDTLKAVLGQRQTFTVNTPEVEPSKPGVMVSAHSGGNVEVVVETGENGAFNCHFTPNTDGVHTVMVCYKMMNITGSPFKIDVQKMPQRTPSHRPPSVSSPRNTTPSVPKPRFSRSSAAYPPSAQRQQSRPRTCSTPEPLDPQGSVFWEPSYDTVESEDDVHWIDPALENLDIQDDEAFGSECLPKSPRIPKPIRGRLHTELKPDLGVWDRIPKKLRTKLDKCLKKGAELTIGKELGKGQFGKVYEARVSEPGKGVYTAAAKTISDTRIKQKDLEDFISEALLMYNFRHPHVLELIGAVVDEDLPYILFPIMDKGSLDAYLRSMKDKLEEQTLLSFGHQVALGMTYISDLKFVHRDLAARNCLLNEQGVVKISDFGLARDNFRSNYVMVATHKKLPLRWMAPEILKTWTFTTETDVWSYAVLLWEIFTYGERPYDAIPTEFVVPRLEDDHRLSKPETAPVEIYKIMLRCWSIDPERRPKFKSIAQDIGTFSRGIAELTYGN